MFSASLSLLLFVYVGQNSVCLQLFFR